jgi:hypothetical protein
MNNGGLSNNSTQNQPGGVMNKSDMRKAAGRSTTPTSAR